MSMNLPESVRNAAINGDLEQVQAALQSGLNINAADENGNTLLMSVAMEGHDNIVTYLLSKGADIKKTDSSGGRAIVRAITSGHISTIKILLENGDSLKNMPINILGSIADTMDVDKNYGDYSQQSGYLETAEILLKNGADPDGTDPKDEEEYREFMEDDIEGLEDMGKRTPLIICARSGLHEMAELLIEYGANTKMIFCGMDVYEHAANRGDQKMMSIIKRGRR
jgi:ankyrin repeat protein